jgi:hypothetical protein
VCFIVESRFFMVLNYHKQTGQLLDFDILVAENDLFFMLGNRHPQKITNDDYLKLANSSDDEALLGFAQSFGCLFGSHAFDLQSETVTEPLDNWRLAAGLLSAASAIKAAIDGRGNGIDLSNLFTAAIYADKESVRTVVTAPQLRFIEVPALYAQVIGERLPTLRRSGDGAEVETTFTCRDNYFFLGLEERRTCLDALAPGVRELSTAEDWADFCKSGLMKYLLYEIVEAHLGVSALYFTDDKRNPLMPGLNCLLSYLWYSFALEFIGGKLATCMECGRIIRATNERGKDRCFCDTACRSRYHYRHRIKPKGVVT